MPDDSAPACGCPDLLITGGGELEGQQPEPDQLFRGLYGHPPTTGAPRGVYQRKPTDGGSVQNDRSVAPNKVFALPVLPQRQAYGRN